MVDISQTMMSKAKLVSYSHGVLANLVGNACSHTTMVDKGQIYCEAMVMSIYLYADQHARMEEDGGTLGLSQ